MKVLSDKAFNVAKNPKYAEYQRRLALMVYKFLIKMSFCGAYTLALSKTFATRDKSAIKIETMSNQKSVEELRKPIIRKFEKGEGNSSFKDDI